MSNFVFYDFETSSSNKYWGQIIQIGAILTNENMEELDRFDARCRLSPGIIPEAMALIVNKSSPKMLKTANLSHYEMIRQFVETLKRWGKATYVGFNSIEFDEEFLRCTLFQTFGAFLEIILATPRVAITSPMALCASPCSIPFNGAI